MISNSSVTLYHYDEATSTWERTVLSGVSIYCRSGATATNSSFSPDNYCVIRIPYQKSVSVLAGDYVYAGNASSKEPSLGHCFKVTSVSENLRGLSPHIKIICA